MIMRVRGLRVSLVKQGIRGEREGAWLEVKPQGDNRVILM